MKVVSRQKLICWFIRGVQGNTSTWSISLGIIIVIGSWLGVVRQQPVTWANVERLVLKFLKVVTSHYPGQWWPNMASLGHIQVKIFIQSTPFQHNVIKITYNIFEYLQRPPSTVVRAWQFPSLFSCDHQSQGLRKKSLINYRMGN